MGVSHIYAILFRCPLTAWVWQYTLTNPTRSLRISPPILSIVNGTCPRLHSLQKCNPWQNPRPVLQLSLLVPLGWDDSPGVPSIILHAILRKVYSITKRLSVLRRFLSSVDRSRPFWGNTICDVTRGFVTIFSTLFLVCCRYSCALCFVSKT